MVVEHGMLRVTFMPIVACLKSVLSNRRQLLHVRFKKLTFSCYHTDKINIENQFKCIESGKQLKLTVWRLLLLKKNEEN